MDKKTVKGVEIYIYDSVDEFREYHPKEKIKFWKDLDVEGGDYIETSMGGVTKCLDVLIMDNQRYISTIMGIWSVKREMDNTVRSYLGRIVPKDGSPPLKDFKFLSAEIKQMGRQMLAGVGKYDAFKKAFPNAKSEGYVKSRVSKIVSSEVFNNFMSEEFTKLLAKEGMDKKWALRVQKGIADDPKAPAHVRKEITDDVIHDYGERLKELQTTEHRWDASHMIDDGELKQIDKIGESTKTKEEKPVE